MFILSFSGREYGTLSIEIHLKSCKQKWEIEESKKAPKDRRPVPEKPSTFDDVTLNLLTFGIDRYRRKIGRRYGREFVGI